MKKILILLLIPICSLSQDKDYNKLIPQKDGRYAYEEVVIVDSIKKDDIYVAAKRWMVDNFKSVKDAIQLDDTEAGMVIGKGFFTFEKSSMMTNYEYWIRFSLEISAKDGKYRIRVYDIIPEEHDASTPLKQLLFERPISVMVSYTSKGAMKKFYKKSLDNINDYILQTIASVKKGISKKNDDF